MTNEVKKHGNARYRWTRFNDGKKHRIQAGVGKRTSNAESLRRQICDAARRLGRKAKTEVHGSMVVFWFLE